MNATLYAAGDRAQAQADFNNDSRGKTVISVEAKDVQWFEYRRSADDLTGDQPSFAVSDRNGPTMHVIFVIYA